MGVVRASRELSRAVAPALRRAGCAAPDRVYVRRETRGRIALLVWGIEHGGVLSEVVEPIVPGRPSAACAIERDLRRGVGLS
jgi:hypothetical protein